MEDNTSYLYNTLLPLMDCDDTMYEKLPSPELLLDEAADASPHSKKKKTKKCDLASKTGNLEAANEELRFINNAMCLSSETSPEQVSTVFRREICDPENIIMLKESTDGEADYLSLEVQGSISVKEEASSVEPVTALLAPKVQNDKVMGFQDFIWSDAHRQIRSPVLLLHQEILDFCHFLSPTLEEQAGRTSAVGRVSEVIKYIWPKCQVKVFGSFETGLYLPSSDIDVVILNSDVQIPQNGLQALSKALLQKSIATKIQVIGKARVPIVKFIEKESNVAFDVSFDVQNGPEAANFIKDAIAKIPPLKPLCLVLKIFLQQRELNEVYSGGIGSFSLLVMLITHLQVHWSRQSSTDGSMILERNLGILLIDFFDLYGRKLNAWDVGVSCRSGGQFYPKNLRGFHNSKRPYLLSVEDPQVPENDIGKSSYNILKVRAAFLMAHRQLTEISVDDVVSSHYSILGRIIKVDEKFLERKAVLMKALRMDAFLSITHTPDLDSDGRRQYSLIEKQGNLLNKWCDNEPLPCGERFEDVHRLPSANRGLKRKWNEENLYNKDKMREETESMHKINNGWDSSNFPCQNSHSKKARRQRGNSAPPYYKGYNSKKRKPISDDEAPFVRRHGPDHRKSADSNKTIECKHLGVDFNNNFGATGVINPAHKIKPL